MRIAPSTVDAIIIPNAKLAWDAATNVKIGLKGNFASLASRVATGMLPPVKAAGAATATTTEMNHAVFAM